MRTCLTVLAVVLLVGVTAGCSDPYTSTTSTQTTSSTTAATASMAGPSSSQLAVRSFATLYINWTYANRLTHERELAAISVGQAHTGELEAAAATAGDAELAAGRLANRGSIVAMAPTVGGPPNQWAVVTREQSMSGANANAQLIYHLTIVTAVPIAGGAWAVSQWLPEP